MTVDDLDPTLRADAVALAGGCDGKPTGQKGLHQVHAVGDIERRSRFREADLRHERSLAEREGFASVCCKSASFVIGPWHG